MLKQILNTDTSYIYYIYFNLQKKEFIKNINLI